MGCTSSKPEQDSVPAVSKAQTETSKSVKTSPTTLKGSPTSLKGSSTSLKGSPTSLKGSSISLKGSPTSFKGSSTSLKGSPTTLKGSSTSLKGSSTSLKGSPTSLKETYNYQKIDQHARKAPESAKNSAEELVNYMLSASKDPRMLARGFFVWSSENIKYDVDGYFGRAKMAPNDAASVMKNGRSVCEGYASVFEELCRKAGIPVKKISGFAKGYSHSAEKPFTLNTRTNHAWNAVQLEGKWYLLDSTWGTGHLDSDTNSFKKRFDNFYFLTDPKQFVSAHFPYMDNNLEESQKWQLLPKLVSLEEFNQSVKYQPEAFRLGAQAVSHQHGYFEMKNELQMTFRSAGKEDIVFSSRLMLKEGNWLKEQRNKTFGYLENGVYKLLVHPPKIGSYEMNIFGKLVSDESHGHYLLEYTIKCTKVKDKDHEYPISYGAADREKCILHEPLRGNLPANTEIMFRMSAPHLEHVEVGETYLEKVGTMFSGKIVTCDAGYKILMYGKRGERYGTLDGLYAFYTV